MANQTLTFVGYGIIRLGTGEVLFMSSDRQETGRKCVEMQGRGEPVAMSVVWK